MASGECMRSNNASTERTMIFVPLIQRKVDGIIVVRKMIQPRIQQAHQRMNRSVVEDRW
jgi:hypothetical protein